MCRCLKQIKAYHGSFLKMWNVITVASDPHVFLYLWKDISTNSAPLGVFHCRMPAWAYRTLGRAIDQLPRRKLRFFLECTEEVLCLLRDRTNWEGHRAECAILWVQSMVEVVAFQRFREKRRGPEKDHKNLWFECYIKHAKNIVQNILKWFLGSMLKSHHVFVPCPNPNGSPGSDQTHLFHRDEARQAPAALLRTLDELGDLASHAVGAVRVATVDNGFFANWLQANGWKKKKKVFGGRCWLKQKRLMLIVTDLINCWHISGWDVVEMELAAEMPSDLCWGHLCCYLSSSFIKKWWDVNVKYLILWNIHWKFII